MSAAVVQPSWTWLVTHLLASAKAEPKLGKLQWKQTNSNKRSEVALCFIVNKQSQLFRKISLRPPQNKCCSLELQPKRYFLQYLNCAAQLNLQLRLFQFVCFSAKVRP